MHWLDIVQMAFDEAMPRSIASMGGNRCFTDNRETPGTQSEVHFERQRQRYREVLSLDLRVFAGDVALRSRMRLDWDERELRVAQVAARGFLTREYRAPWKLEV